MIGLIQKAETEIVLVDGYVDVGTLNILSKKKENVVVTVYTLQRTKLSQTDVDNFNAQYPKLDVKYTRAFHDRFLILDKTKAYCSYSVFWNLYEIFKIARYAIRKIKERT